jgi:hypothetical protein
MTEYGKGNGDTKSRKRKMGGRKGWIGKGRKRKGRSVLR